MVKGGATVDKVHLSKAEEDFIVYVDDVAEYQKWRKEVTEGDGKSSIPLASFAGTFEVFTTHKQGTQGTHDAAPKSMLDNVFGTNNTEEAMKVILKEGNLQQQSGPERQGPGKDAGKMGPVGA